MNDDASKLHGILLKYKIKFRPSDHDLRQPLQSHYVGVAPVAVFTARCLTQEVPNLVQSKSDYLGNYCRAALSRLYAWPALVSTAAK